MRCFALGCLGYDPERFGKMRLGDFLDALTGYNQRENERFKNIAELVRLSTSILWNVQVARKDKLKPEQLMPFPWDEKELKPVVYDKERMEEGYKRFEDILNGTGNQ